MSASFDKFINQDVSNGETSVVFGADTPLLEVELNESQAIKDKQISDVLGFIGKGIYPLNSVYARDLGAVGGTEIKKGTCFVVNVDGYNRVFKVPESIVTSTITPSSTDKKYLCIVWSKRTVTHSDVMYKNGYRGYFSESSTQMSGTPVVVTNSVKDIRLNIETSRRTVYEFAVYIGQTDPTSDKVLSLLGWENGNFNFSRVGHFYNDPNKGQIFENYNSWIGNDVNIEEPKDYGGPDRVVNPNENNWKKKVIILDKVTFPYVESWTGTGGSGGGPANGNLNLDLTPYIGNPKKVFIGNISAGSGYKNYIPPYASAYDYVQCRCYGVSNLTSDNVTKTYALLTLVNKDGNEVSVVNEADYTTSLVIEVFYKDYE